MDDLHAGIGPSESGEKLAHAIELELPCLVGNERRALVVDARHEPIERGIAPARRQPPALPGVHALSWITTHNQFGKPPAEPGAAGLHSCILVRRDSRSKK